MQTLGVHSEVGTLRTVMVCRPGLAHQRLTPGNRADLLFDDVLWVQEAQKDHYDFVLKMRERGVEVLELHDLLAETLADKQARAWVLDRRITANDVGLGTRAGPARLARRAAGGEARRAPHRRHRDSRPAEERADRRCSPTRTATPTSSSRRCPTRCFSATRRAGSTTASPCNPMFWPARKPETLLQRAVYKFHPRFKGADFTIWWGDCDESFGAATLEGGDVMPIGNGVVLIGMGERTTRQAVFQVAAELFKHKAATRVIACLMPKSRAAMHLDTVFTFCDRDLCTTFREVADQIRCYSARPDGNGRVEVRADKGHLFDVVKEALGLKHLRVVETGGNAWEAQREQWDDGNNVVALAPGVVVGLRPQHAHEHAAAQGRRRSDHRARRRARPRARRRPLHDVPDLARSGVIDTDTSRFRRHAS